MSNRDRDFLTRTESKKRSNRTQGRKKLDRLLNVLIAVVAVLIIINLYFVFSNNEEKTDVTNEVDSTQTSNKDAENKEQQQHNDSNSGETDTNSTGNGESAGNSSANSSTTKDNSEENSSSDQVANEDGNESQNQVPTNAESLIVQDSDDPLVDQVIIDPNWQVTPTTQTGEHVSTYQDGHIDYEEKKLTFQNAVGLEKDNIIYWRINNNGSSETSIAVVSSKDLQSKYRISIEWMPNQGWKPVKVEILNELEGA
ncbi:YrrS family protein [Ureibacillus manganicus]|uniref:DUF1510 domain-containing protein n=1 Tax=Ureibacillus manganicus DSM 26584 TaxID=1384049 RepID=A0A0A3I1G0_9BACL|nr:YrrS family protein [Ureibacillus manganicus]KGR78574.1 hypothetical protein CD29_11045 [Ureibacillus manganicus DSM 26584]